MTVHPAVPGGQTITMNYSTYDGTATEGEDYEYTYGHLTFTAGQHTKIVRVPVLHDSVDEDEEIVGFSIGSTRIGTCCGNEVHATKRTAQGTIRNLQSQLSVADAEATEGTDATMDFVVTLDPATTWPVSVKYETRNGTARAGRDYTYTRGTLRFDPYYLIISQFAMREDRGHRQPPSGKLRHFAISPTAPWPASPNCLCQPG